ncbi:MAG: hypothetical protein A2027_04595 [Thermodesulfovibrio sp. RBG_19FT_COMBO_41_18]|nr:MAG: hypothetical protein A2027_04595 [Thermodesulfovibrio sp. RBG_19FT_COMBO_41_18]
MKKYLIHLFSVFILIYLSVNAYSITGDGNPLKYISSCELDFNNDNEPDLALLVETLMGRQLIVLLKTAKGYNTFVVSRGKPDMHLSCHFGKIIKETTAGGGKGRTYKTPGTYIKLTRPEASSVVYFWDGKGFKEVWTSD